MQIPPTSIHVGQRVRVRRLRWRVTQLHPFDRCQVLTLSGIDPRNVGRERRVLTPFDDLEAVDEPTRPRPARPRVWRRSCRALLAANHPGPGLRTAARAGIDLLPHQLEPALAVLAGDGCRLLLADEVGLGKTIQAGLVLAELMAINAVERTLLLTPPGLRDQWAAELATRFGIDAVILDMASLGRRMSELPADQNPWTTYALVIASLDYVKRPEVLPAVACNRWDLILVDEAHAAASGTDRFAAVQALSRLSPYVVLLSATPHSGDGGAFTALCGLGSHGAPGDSLLIFRRRRTDVSLGVARRVHPLFTEPSPAELQMHGLLDRFERMVRRDRGTRDPDAQLALAVLRKRAHSSAHSLARTVERRLAALAGEARTEHQLQLPLDDAGEMDMSDEDPLLTARLLDDLDVERRLFDALREAAVRVSGHETKIRRLIRLLKALDRRNEPVVVFTEYRDTLHQLAQALPIRSLCLHGGMPRQERRMALDAFVRRTHTILLATDAAGEGLNLQAGCRTVVNLELPWNPNRLEQRIGRVDRIGQTRTVHVFHLIGARTAEVGMLARLRTRVEAARAEFDAVDPLVSSAASGPPTDIVPAASAGNRSWRWMPARAEAVAECARLERARALAHKKSTSHQITNSPNHQITKSPNEVHPGPLVCTTRRRRLKMALSGGLLVIVESVCHNACGSVIASRVIPLLVRLKCPISMHAPAFKQVLETLRLLAPCIAVPSQTDWERQIRECHHRFWTAEQARERSIARWLDGLQVSALQPGLFDQRAERERAVDQADRLDLQAALARRRALGNRLMELDPVQTCVRVVIGDHQLLGKPPAC